MMIKRKPYNLNHIGALGYFLALFSLLIMFTPQNVKADDPVETIIPNFTATCTSTGQLCDPPFSVSVETGSLLQVHYFVTHHCSSIRLHIFVDGTLKTTTGFLGWPNAEAPFSALPLDTGLLDLGTVPPGTHLLELQAEGQISGCNQGQGLVAWHGKLIVITLPRSIKVQGNDVTIANGDTTPASVDHTDFGNVLANSGRVVRTFTVSNIGSVDLTLTNISISPSGAFAVTTNPAPTTIASADSTTFAVTFEPNMSGVLTATVTIANSDSDENPFTFVVGGMASGQLNTGGQVTQQSVATFYDPVPQTCGTEILPIYTVTPTLLNNTNATYDNLYFLVREFAYIPPQMISGVPVTPTLCNADGGASSAIGTRLSVADATLGDGLLAPNESFAQPFQVGLPVRARFCIFVNLYGIPDTVVAADADPGQLLGMLRLEFDQNGNLVNRVPQFYLPIVAK